MQIILAYSVNPQLNRHTKYAEHGLNENSVIPAGNRRIVGARKVGT
jgi:hypothetical protein